MRRRAPGAAVLQRAAAPSLLLLRRRVDTAPCGYRPCNNLRRGISAQSAGSKSNSGAPRHLRRPRFESCNVMLFAAKTEMLCKSRQMHPSKRQPVSASEHSSREVGNLFFSSRSGSSLQEAFWSWLISWHRTGGRAARGSLIRTGSNAATSEQLHRAAATPTAAPAALHR